MPAELPSFWQGDRRAFLRGGAEIAKKAGLIYTAAQLSPLLAACTEGDGAIEVPLSQEEPPQELFIPDRSFSPERIKWQKEGENYVYLREVEKDSYLFGQLARMTRQGTVFIEDLSTGEKVTARLPKVELASNLRLSPTGEQLAVWARTPSGEQVFLLDLTKKNPSFERLLNERTDYPEGTLEWSENGQFLAAASCSHGSYAPFCGTVRIFDTATGHLVYQLNKSEFTSFSPDSNWALIQMSPSELRLVNLSTREAIRVFPATFVSRWSADGRKVVFESCQTTRKDSFNNTLWCKDNEHLTIVDLVTRKAQLVELPDYGSILTFSPDGRTLLFTQQETKLYALDLENWRIRKIVEAEGWRIETSTNKRHFQKIAPFDQNNVLTMAVLLSPTRQDLIDIYKLRLTDGVVVEKTRINLGNREMIFHGFLDAGWVSFIEYGQMANPLPPRAHFSVISLASGRHYSLGRSQDGEFVDFSTKIIGDKSLVAAKKANYLFANRRFYPVSLSAAEFLADDPPVQIPSSTLTEIPQSENKIEFTGGDLITDDEDKLWYLRNAVRYGVNETIDGFVQKRRKPMKVWEMPSWVIDKIALKEFPSRFFKDQYGRIIDGHSPRLIVLVAGWDSDSQEVVTTFEGVIKKLKQIGWNDGQILFGTYNFETNPLFYTKENARQFVGLSRDAIRHFLGWIKLKAPTSQLVLCGHSQGGDLALNAALSHTDAVCQVITINSPLKGVDQAFIRANSLDLDRVGFILGEAAQFYVTAGDDESYGEQIENQINLLKRHSVEIFTFTATGDKLIKGELAVLKNSHTNIGDYSIQLLWDVDTGLVDFLESHGILLTHDPFIDELARVIGRP